MKFAQRLKALFTGRTYFTNSNDISIYTLAERASRVKNYACKTVQGQREAYTNCPPLTAIINNKCAMAINGIWQVVDKNDKEPGGMQAERIRNLLKKPNQYQGWNAFFSFAKTMNQVFGRCYIYMETPVGFDRSQTTAMYIMPNWCVTPVYNYDTSASRFIRLPMRYDITLWGTTFQIAPEDMMIWNDIGFDLSSNDYDFTSGGSRLVSLTDPISNIVAAYEARNVQLCNSGPPGILSPDGKDVSGFIPLLPEQKEELQSDLRRRYGLQRDKWQTLISTSALKYQSIGKPTRDLMVFEEIEDDVRQLCDNYGYPMYLFGFKSGTTFSNLKEAKAQAYQNAIIPESHSFNRTFEQFFNMAKSGLRLIVVYDHIEELQKSEKEKAETLKLYLDIYMTLFDKGLITSDQLLEFTGINTTLMK